MGKSKAHDYSQLAQVGRDQVALSEPALDHFKAEAKRKKRGRDQTAKTDQGFYQSRFDYADAVAFGVLANQGDWP